MFEHENTCSKKLKLHACSFREEYFTSETKMYSNKSIKIQKISKGINLQYLYNKALGFGRLFDAMKNNQ